MILGTYTNYAPPNFHSSKETKKGALPNLLTGSVSLDTYRHCVVVSYYDYVLYQEMK